MVISLAITTILIIIIIIRIIILTVKNIKIHKLLSERCSQSRVLPTDISIIVLAASGHKQVLTAYLI